MREPGGTIEMYMFVNATDETSAIQLVKESVPHPISVTSVELIDWTS